MRTPQRKVLGDGRVVYRVRFRLNGTETSRTFRGPEAKTDAERFVEALWEAGGARVDKEVRIVRAEPPERAPRWIPSTHLRSAVERRGGLAELTRWHASAERARLERAYQRAVASGRVTVRSADDLATRLLQLHPVDVWGEAWPA